MTFPLGCLRVCPYTKRLPGLRFAAAPLDFSPSQNLLDRHYARLRSHSEMMGQISCCALRLAMIRAWL